jgi:transposase-like protein
VRNGSWSKTVISDAAREVVVEVPRDREDTFKPQIVKKRQRWLMIQEINRWKPRVAAARCSSQQRC